MYPLIPSAADEGGLARAATPVGVQILAGVVALTMPQPKPANRTVPSTIHEISRLVLSKALLFRPLFLALGSNFQDSSHTCRDKEDCLTQTEFTAVVVL